MNTHRIFYFSDESGETEFVVISDRDTKEIQDEFGEGVALVKTLEVVGDGTTLPCDRILSKE